MDIVKRSATLPALFLAIPLVAQLPVRQLTQDNGDCTGAIPISDSIYVQEWAVRGFGNKLEIKENPKEHHQWFEREHHTTWYKFRVPVKCNLTFDIIPNDLNDDIDFLLFEGNIPGICDKVGGKQITPVRSNISRNDPALGSRCGLAKDAPDDYVRSGVGASYSRSIDVEAGQLFYLVIDHQERPRAGYTIHLHYDMPPAPPVPEVVVRQKKKQRVLINVLDASNNAPLEASIAVKGMTYDGVVEASGRSSYDYQMDVYRNLTVTCLRSGYMLSSTRIKASDDPEVKLDLKLQPIQPGEHVILEDIRFVGDADQVMRSSEGALQLLLRFMQINPTVKIEIQGHVNGPTFKNKKEFIELSRARAKTVHDFLVAQGIAVERLSFKGMGNSQMIHPDPKNKEQSEANRRVEIRITGT
jgi:outer membrane protein OmpA-like peptidoglycan-associated protein